MKNGKWHKPLGHKFEHINQINLSNSPYLINSEIRLITAEGIAFLISSEKTRASKNVKKVRTHEFFAARISLTKRDLSTIIEFVRIRCSKLYTYALKYVSNSCEFWSSTCKVMKVISGDLDLSDKKARLLPSLEYSAGNSQCRCWKHPKNSLI